MKLFNSLTRKKEEFKPLNPGEVKMYVCGPTVYDYIHIGNARPMVVFDTLRRYLIYKGYDVDYVVNFTDIDDKIIQRANERGVSSEEIANQYIEEFKRDAEGLNIYEEHTNHPRATSYITPIIRFVSQLIEKGAAYEVNGNVYFNIDAAKDYGKLSKKSIDDLKSGARIEINKEKKNPMDFVLWKNSKPGEPSWDSPWGKGRPGWHIECSVMSKELLGETIDIHAGGEDLQFPHHENEIAQSETLSGKTFANYWLHNGMLTINDKKMSKSLGNFFTVREIGEVFDLEVLRLFLISAHYRNPINFSREILEQTEAGLERLYNGKYNLEYLLETAEEKEEEKEIREKIDSFKAKFIESMDDDINTADGVSVLFDLVRYANSEINKNTSKTMVEYTYNTLMELAGVLGILNKEKESLEEDIEELIEKRQEARKNKDFQLADQIRDDLLEKGIVLEDTAEGVKWRRV